MKSEDKGKDGKAHKGKRPAEHKPKEQPSHEGNIAYAIVDDPSEISSPSSSRRYIHTLFVRATEEEKTSIFRRAKSANLSASRFLVRAALEGKAPPTREEQEGLERLLFLLKRASLHLSRLSTNVHALRLAGAMEPVREELQQTALLLQSLMKEIQKRL